MIFLARGIQVLERLQEMASWPAINHIANWALKTLTENQCLLANKQIVNTTIPTKELHQSLPVTKTSNDKDTERQLK